MPLAKAQNRLKLTSARHSARFRTGPQINIFLSPAKSLSVTLIPASGSSIVLP